MGQLDKFKAKIKKDGIYAALNLGFMYLLRKTGVRWGERPFEYVQSYVQRHLHQFLQVERTEVKNIIIVGAHLGYEVRPMLRRFPNVKFFLFEASPRYLFQLKKRYSSEQRVKIYDNAVTDTDGRQMFFETNLIGSGSLLQVGELARDSYGMAQAEQFEVATVQLDTHAGEHGYIAETIDCLWIDVQGAEIGVLKGAEHMLKKTRSVFLEVSVYKQLYNGGAIFHELENILFGNGFRLALIGTDPTNGTGNALFVQIN